jgi:hypothetical protein
MNRPTLLLLIPLTLPVMALAEPSVATGKKLVAENKCETCHTNKVGGDGSDIYKRKDRRVTSLAKLKSQIALCNSELNIGLFPEDEEHIAAYLNATHYKFTKQP